MGILEPTDFIADFPPFLHCPFPLAKAPSGARSRTRDCTTMLGERRQDESFDGAKKKKVSGELDTED